MYSVDMETRESIENRGIDLVTLEYSDTGTKKINIGSCRDIYTFAERLLLHIWDRCSLG